jgi:hypothetical protein
VSKRDEEFLAEEYAGRYGHVGSPGVAIDGREEGLVLRLPGAPPGFEIPLRPEGPDAFRVSGAGDAGAAAHFARDPTARIVRLELGGVVSLPRHPDAEPPDYLLGPKPETDEGRTQAFEAVYAASVAPATGEAIAYDLPYPKHELLRYLCDEHELLVHGSNDSAIEEFAVARQSLGPLQGGSDSGVSACADGIWAIAYAILDRSRGRGAFHNSVIPLGAHAGAPRLYHFSVPREALALDPPPWTEGTVYLLPKATFSRVGQGLFGSSALEWTSPVAVRPVARLAVSPADFPLLARVHGHDDTQARRALDLRDRLLAEAAAAEPLEDGYDLEYEPRDGLLVELGELIELHHVFFPWLEALLHVPPGEERILLRLTGATGLRDQLGHELERISRKP